MYSKLFLTFYALFGLLLALGSVVCCGEEVKALSLFGQNKQSETSSNKASISSQGSRPAVESLVFGIKDKGVFSDLDGSVFYPLFINNKSEDIELLVNKKKRTLSVLYKGLPIKSYPVALGFTPVGDKQISGDGKTPEGEYYICEKLHEDLAPKYGARSMRISYPGVNDAKRGRSEGIISKAQKGKIENAISKKEMPLQNTKLGSSIRIHGGGVSEDWTAGCIALRDEDVIELYDIVKDGTLVTVTANGKKSVKDVDGDGIPNQVDIAAGALKTAINGADYDGSYHKISYPGGDVDRSIGVCTDVVIRALRNAGIDLQQKMGDDILSRRAAYPNITKPNTNIDHRRVSNMLIYMNRHMRSLPIDGDWMPGDIVLFDTLPKSGPDHIGIVSPYKGISGLLLAINNWTTGSKTTHIDLLSWCPVTHHFRMK